MRAERRHELQQNKLALWVANAVQRVRPHVNKIILGVTALVAAIVIISVSRAYSARGQSVAWETLFHELGHPGTDGLETLADETPNAPPGRWAALVAAERHLALGSQLLFTNKENATQELRKAVAEYTTAIGPDGKGEPELLEQAYFGRAKAYESLAGADLGNREDIDKAIADYQELLARWPNGPYSIAAKRQLDILGSIQGKRFYEKFAAFRPRPPVTRQSGQLPPLDELLRKAIPEGAESAKQPSLDEILKGLEATTPKPDAGTPAAKPGAGTPTPKPSAATPPAGKSQPPVTEPPKAGPVKPEPTKPEPAKSEPPKASPAPDPAKAAPAKPEAGKKN
jgi:hypothetical protein